MYLNMHTIEMSNRVGAAIAQSAQFRTHADCLDQAAERAKGFAQMGRHGTYFCMYHGEPDRELADSPQWKF